MPIYAYHCQGCGHELEKIQRISDAPLTDCPECKQPALKKKITAAAFKLTGTGWYETDFKNKKQPEKTESTTSSEQSKTPKPEKKSEDKTTTGTAKKDAA